MTRAQFARNLFAAGGVGSVCEETEFVSRDDMVQELVTENQALNDRLAVVAMDATEDEKSAAKSLIDELREEIRQLQIELAAVKISRDSYQRDNAQLKKQCAMYQKQLKKA
jgi:predicted TIM-barrel fold metal-dependent hydrolase